jgi:hypothetical protein
MEGRTAELIDLRPYIVAKRLREQTRYTGEKADALQRAAARIDERMREDRASRESFRI